MVKNLHDINVGFYKYFFQDGCGKIESDFQGTLSHRSRIYCTMSGKSEPYRLVFLLLDLNRTLAEWSSLLFAKPRIPVQSFHWANVSMKAIGT